MPVYPDAIVVRLSQSLHVDRGFIIECIEERVIEIREEKGEWSVVEGGTLQLRRLQRVCHTFNVNVPVAKHILDLTDRLAQLEYELSRLR